MNRQPVIAQGRHAGQPRPSTDQILDQTQALKEAILKCKLNGLEVIAADCRIGLTPTVQVAPNRVTKKMIEEDEAAYFRYSLDSAGQETRAAQFMVGSVRVLWIERVVH